MEYKEGRCPKCGEAMQIPSGREKLICMFCGQEFSVLESREKEEAAYKEQLERFRERAGLLFHDMDKTIMGFQKDKYVGSFEQYLIAQQENLKLIRSAMLAAPDRERAASELSEIITGCAGELMDAHKGRLGKESAQMTLNMYTVTYVLPAILSIDNEQYADLADAVCEKWSIAFKNSKIQAAGYESLQSGFRRKLCYITTAVCEGMNKPADCYELKLLKNYRDGYLADMPDGEEVISQYYDIAPTIVKRINKQKDHATIYRSLYEAYISPCVRLIEEEKNDECREKYQEMVEMLRREYM